MHGHLVCAARRSPAEPDPRRSPPPCDGPFHVRLLDYRDWPHRRLHSPRAERMREKIAVTPSARSVQTEKAPLDLAIPAPAVCTTGMDDPRSDPRRMMTYPDRRSASTSVPYSQTTRMSTENKNPVWAIPPWWKLDPSRSKLTDQMKVE